MTNGTADPEPAPSARLPWWRRVRLEHVAESATAALFVLLLSVGIGQLGGLPDGFAPPFASPTPPGTGEPPPPPSEIFAIPRCPRAMEQEALVPRTDNGMVLVPSGVFLRGSCRQQIAEYGANCADVPFLEAMGCGRAWFRDELPLRSVHLDAFWIDVHEVTNSEFALFVEEVGHVTSAEAAGESVVVRVRSGEVHQRLVDSASWRHPSGPGSSVADLGDYPVVHISWFDARSYCHWMDARLPTEAEWEKAARGTDGRPYTWGYEWDVREDPPRLNFFGVRPPSSRPVESFPNGRSVYGAMDMLGNVFEWVRDWYRPDFYELGDVTNPVNSSGRAASQLRVRRGGAWGTNPALLHISWRLAEDPAATSSASGFRCARNA